MSSEVRLRSRSRVARSRVPELTHLCLTDLQEELGITRTQLKELQTAPLPKAATPPRQIPLEGAPGLEPTPANDFATPRKVSSPTLSSPPSISLEQPTPRRASPPPRPEPTSPIPPVPATRPEDRDTSPIPHTTATRSSVTNGLSRSTKTWRLAGSPAVGHASPMMPSRAIRELSLIHI